MPANLTPQYIRAEGEFRKATTIEDKIACLKKMLALIPKHKGTDHLRADLRRKMAQLNREQQAGKKGRRRSRLRIDREGAGQVMILGGPNAGKSQLLASLTAARPEVAAYPYTTHHPTPGMMAFEDVQVQLVDTPAITEDYLETGILEVIRGADAAALLADLSAADGETPDVGAAAEAVRQRLRQGKIDLQGLQPEASEDISIYPLKTWLVGNKIDAPGADAQWKRLEERFGDAFPMLAISAAEGTGLEALRTKLFEMLDVIRVYSKQPGRKVDLKDPFTLPRGSTVLEMARRVHKDFADGLQFARIWGSGAFDGQSVKRDHVLEDRDILELHLVRGK